MCVGFVVVSVDDDVVFVVVVVSVAADGVGDVGVVVVVSGGGVLMFSVAIIGEPGRRQQSNMFPQHSTTQHVTTQHSTALHNTTTQHSTTPTKSLLDIFSFFGLFNTDFHVIKHNHSNFDVIITHAFSFT